MFAFPVPQILSFLHDRDPCNIIFLNSNVQYSLDCCRLVLRRIFLLETGHLRSLTMPNKTPAQRAKIMNEKRVRNKLNSIGMEEYPKESFFKIEQGYAPKALLHSSHSDEQKKAAREKGGNQLQIMNELLPKPSNDEGEDGAIHAAFL